MRYHQVKENISWRDVLSEYKKSEDFKKLLAFITYERNTKKHIFPKKEDTFNAFKLCPLRLLKLVIIGQDPYHNINQANGLAFSVKGGIKLPPSLVNIYKELNNDLKIPISNSGDLRSWAKQGVFLLNNVLTVEAHKPCSHTNKGWENFTDHVISQVDKYKNNVVFLLWGVVAQRKVKLINTDKHFILKASHPSPLSAHCGFLGCKHFSRANQYLIKNRLTPIDWRV